jgi:hypothetical protein
MPIRPQHLVALGDHLGALEVHARRIDPRRVDAFHEAELHRIEAGDEEDRNPAGGCLGHLRGANAAQGGDQGHVPLHQFVRIGLQPIFVAFGPPIFDLEVSAFVIAALPEALAKGGHQALERLG